MHPEEKRIWGHSIYRATSAHLLKLILFYITEKMFIPCKRDTTQSLMQAVILPSFKSRLPR